MHDRDGRVCLDGGRGRRRSRVLGNRRCRGRRCYRSRGHCIYWYRRSCSWGWRRGLRQQSRCGRRRRWRRGRWCRGRVGRTRDPSASGGAGLADSGACASRAARRRRRCCRRHNDSDGGHPARRLAKGGGVGGRLGLARPSRRSSRATVPGRAGGARTRDTQHAGARSRASTTGHVSTKQASEGRRLWRSSVVQRVVYSTMS
jgi:hypothetical protein